MPRLVRLVPGGVIFHVVNRANARCQVFEDNRDCQALWTPKQEQIGGILDFPLEPFCPLAQSALDRGCKSNRIGEKNKSILRYGPKSKADDRSDSEALFHLYPPACLDQRWAKNHLMNVAASKQIDPSTRRIFLSSRRDYTLLPRSDPLNSISP